MTGKMENSTPKGPDLPTWLFSLPVSKLTKDNAVKTEDISFYIYYRLSLGMYV
jgi:hypothetical protein